MQVSIPITAKHIKITANIIANTIITIRHPDGILNFGIIIVIGLLVLIKD
jgi:hypothetical protein